MKVRLVTYQHESNGMAIQVMPETDAEVEILRSMWAHGRLAAGHPCGGTGGIGFYIKAFAVAREGAGEERG